MPAIKYKLDVELLERLYAEGANQSELSERFGVSPKTVRRRLLAAGVAIRRRLPRPTCAREGCEKEACGPRAKFCSRACFRQPKPPPRPCELESCRRPFVPDASKLARGAGRFCSYACWNAWREGRPQREWANNSCAALG